MTDAQPLKAFSADAPDLSENSTTTSGMSMLANSIAGHSNAPETIILENGTKLTVAPTHRTELNSLHLILRPGSVFRLS